MPLPTIANCYQVKLIWVDALEQRQATNVFHVSDAVGAGDEVAIMAALDGHVTANMWLLQCTTASVVRVDITYLGIPSATRSFTPVTPAHWTGAGGTDPIPQGCSVVTLQTATRGKSHRGRLYLPWIAELEQTAGLLNGANVITSQAAWTAFLAAMSAAAVPISVASAKLSSQTLVTSFLYRPYLKTQRRRARR